MKAGLRPRGLGYGRGTESRPLLERFESMIRKDGAGGCWEWLGSRRGRRYGCIGIQPGGTMLAHRAAWTLFRGPIPDGVKVCHRCDNLGCVNPDHLFLGTQRDNVLDMYAKGRNADFRGSRNGKAKITEEVAREIKRCLSAGEQRTSIARALGVSVHIVHDIALGRTWGHA